MWVDKMQGPRYFQEMKQGFIAAFRCMGCCLERCCVGGSLIDKV
jgi:hypothetical protein